MNKAEQFIKDCTRSCSNVVYYHNRNFTHGTDYVEGSGIEVQYSPWLTPDQALRAVEIAREEMIAKAYEWINFQLNLPSDFEQHFRKAMEE